MSRSRASRQERLRETLRENPFLTDFELARQLGVSVQTVRLDRMALAIPELRVRTKAVAERVHGLVRSMGAKEIVGELVDLQPGKSAVSILETTRDMAFERSGVIRGHYIFAQADSLAIALVASDTVLTGLANVKFQRPARVDERLVARAEVIRQLRSRASVVLVVTRAAGQQLFRGKFTVFALEDPAKLQEEVEP
ncbi:MAG TPA: transcription factor FapR [Clostridiales bacterium UBA8153]|nr:transcription factor FapR [Clostridiales bacterium UBA8153]